MLNDLIDSDRKILNEFNQSFKEIIKIKTEEDISFIKLLENSKRKEIEFTDLLLMEKNSSEETNKIKREILNKTEFAQPAILLHSYLNFKKFLKEKFCDEEEFYKQSNCYFFGPSLGEIISLVCANSLPLRIAGILLYKRGKFMQESCPKGIGSMLNVIGDIEKNINLFNNFLEINKKNVSISSIMSKRLLVLSGESELIDKCMKFYKDNSVGCRKLIVSAAFHSDLMQEGKLRFRQFLNEEMEGIKFTFPKVKIISTIYPEFIYETKENNSLDSKNFDMRVKELLVEQFTRKVNLLESVLKYKEVTETNQENNLYDIIKRKNVDLNDYI